MSSNADHGVQNPDNPYCIHCTDLKGKLLPFEKLYEDLVSQAMQTRWMNHQQAEKSALAETPNPPAPPHKPPQTPHHPHQPQTPPPPHNPPPHHTPPPPPPPPPPP